VHPSKAGGYICDDQCIGYKSSKICAHTVAAALKSDSVVSFLHWYKGLKSKPNFSALADHGKPPVGKKPHKGVSKRKSRSVHNIVLNSNEEDFSSRVQLDDSGEGSSSSQTVDGSFTSMQSADMGQFSPLSGGSVNQDLHSGTVPYLTLSNSPVSVQNFGYNTFGQSVQNATGPPPLVHIPSVVPPGTVVSSPTAHILFSPIQQERRPSVETQFWLCFVHGNISRCNGCKGKIGRSEANRPLPPPGDIVFHHRETVIFQNPKTGIFQQSKDPRNVYYHALKTCIAPNFLNFNSSHISIDASIQAQLTSAHVQHLYIEFGLKV